MTTALKQGDFLDGRYQLQDELGRGPFSRVFKATQVELDRDVVIKFLTAKDSETRVRARFRREARLLSQLSHPNTLILYDFGWSKTEQPFLVTEHVPGVTLWKVLKHHGALEPARAVEIIRQVLYSLREAHSKDIIHRDMKPDNVMLFDTAHERDRVKVLDFGIAKFADNTLRTRPNGGAAPEVLEDEDLDEPAPEVTLNGRLVGTPRYMAPEFLAGEEATPSSDLYAVGLVFFEMLTGRRAVPGKTPAQIIARQLSPAPILSEDDESIPAPLREVVRLATHKDASTRLSSCKDFLKHLDRIKPEALGSVSDSLDEGNDPDLEAQPSFVSLYSIAADIVAADGLSDSGWPSEDLGSILQPIKLRSPRSKLGKAIIAKDKKAREAREEALEEISLKALNLDGLDDLKAGDLPLEELPSEDFNEVESLDLEPVEPEESPRVLLFDPSSHVADPPPPTPEASGPEDAPGEEPEVEEAPLDEVERDTEGHEGELEEAPGDEGDDEEGPEGDEDLEDDEAVDAFDPVVIMPKPSLRRPVPLDFDAPEAQPLPPTFYATVLIILLGAIVAVIVWQWDSGDSKVSDTSPTPPALTEKPSLEPPEAPPAPKEEVAAAPVEVPEAVPREVVEVPAPEEVAEDPAKEAPLPVEEEKVDGFAQGNVGFDGGLMMKAHFLDACVLSCTCLLGEAPPRPPWVEVVKTGPRPGHVPWARRSEPSTV